MSTWSSFNASDRLLGLCWWWHTVLQLLARCPPFDRTTDQYFASARRAGLFVERHLLQQPLDALLYALAGDRIRGLNVPLFMRQLAQSQQIANLHRRQGVLQVHLVGKEQKWNVAHR